MKLKQLSSEMLFVIAMITNSFTLVLMVKSSFGVSTLSSVPLVFSNVFTSLSLGTWTILIQVLYIVLMVMYTRTLKYGYLGSFVVSIVFGVLVDAFTVLTTQWSTEVLFRILYFTVGIIGMGIGAAFFVLCNLPILPFDLIVRELSNYTKRSVKVVKRSLDVVSVIISISLSLLALGQIVGVGIGTIISIFLMGEIIQKVISFINGEYDVIPKTKIGKVLTSIS